MLVELVEPLSWLWHLENLTESVSHEEHILREPLCVECFIFQAMFSCSLTFSQLMLLIFLHFNLFTVPCKNIKNQTTFRRLHGKYQCIWFLDMPQSRLLRSCCDWPEDTWPLLSSFRSILCCIVPPSMGGSVPVSVRGWRFLPTTSDIIVTLMSSKQHAAAEGDHGTFPSGPSQQQHDPLPQSGPFTTTIPSVPPPDTRTCCLLSPYWSVGPRQDPPVRWQETV